MHRVFFSVKRVHLRVVEESKLLVRRFGLTPARFDLLRVVDAHEPHAVLQSKICTLLGVSATTVSRMLVALERLGFVERTRLEGDRRNLLVKLTVFGWDRLDEALVACVALGKAQALAWMSLSADTDLAIVRLQSLQKNLNAMRRAFGDGAPFVDPWRADGLVAYHYTTVVKGRVRYTADLGKPRVQYDDDRDSMTWKRRRRPRARCAAVAA